MTMELKVELKAQWEEVYRHKRLTYEYVERMVVPGGWLYRVHSWDDHSGTHRIETRFVPNNSQAITDLTEAMRELGFDLSVDVANRITGRQ